MKNLKIMMMTLMMCLITMFIISRNQNDTSTKNQSQSDNLRQKQIEDSLKVVKQKQIEDSLKIVKQKQIEDSVYLVKETDEMSGKTYVYGNRRFIVANDEGKIGFSVGAYIRDNMSFGFITVTMVGIGNCNENDEIIILFENGERITKKSWLKFNCDGDAYFFMNEKEIQLLRTEPMSKIRMTNGWTYDSYTGDVKEKDKRYFIQLFYALDNKLLTEK